MVEQESKSSIILGGALIGFLGVLFSQWEASENCWTCLQEQLISLGAKLPTIGYFSLEIVGIILGAACLAICRKEFDTSLASLSWLYFVLGFMVMMGVFIFLGCPFRMAFRLGTGDLNALSGLVGLICGILLGLSFLKKGFTIPEKRKTGKKNKLIYWGVMISFLLYSWGRPLSFYLKKGHLDFSLSLVLGSLFLGLIIGLVAQYTRFCLMAGFRNLFLCRDTYLLHGFLALVFFSTLTNLNAGDYQLNFNLNTGLIWGFGAMVLIGWASLYLGGCPLRQLVLLGEGKIKALLVWSGMLVGAWFGHWGQISATTFQGKLILILSLLFLLAISCYYSEKEVT